MSVAECGTRAAYQRHIRAGETTCQPCRDANTAATNAYRRLIQAARPTSPGDLMPEPVRPPSWLACDRCGRDEQPVLRVVDGREVLCGPCSEGVAAARRADVAGAR